LREFVQRITVTELRVAVTELRVAVVAMTSFLAWLLKPASFTRTP
jgi:hypothetical protein